MFPSAGGAAGLALRMGALGERPLVLALEWVNGAAPLLLWPWFVALGSVLACQDRPGLGILAKGCALLSAGLLASSGAFTATALHALGSAYGEAAMEAREAIVAVMAALLAWMRGLNQAGSLLYQTAVFLVAVGMIAGRLWRGWGWVGLIGALLAVPAKVSLGIIVPTNFVWTGLAYAIWPIAVGVKLLGHRPSVAEVDDERRDRELGAR